MISFRLHHNIILKMIISDVWGKMPMLLALLVLYKITIIIKFIVHTYTLLSSYFFFFLIFVINCTINVYRVLLCIMYILVYCEIMYHRRNRMCSRVFPRPKRGWGHGRPLGKQEGTCHPLRNTITHRNICWALTQAF